MSVRWVAVKSPRFGRLRVVYEYNIAPELFSIMGEAVKQIQALGRVGDWVLATATEHIDVGELDKFEPREHGSLTLNMPVSGFVDSVVGKI